MSRLSVDGARDDAQVVAIDLACADVVDVAEGSARCARLDLRVAPVDQPAVGQGVGGLDDCGVAAHLRPGVVDQLGAADGVGATTAPDATTSIDVFGLRTLALTVAFKVNAAEMSHRSAATHRLNHNPPGAHHVP